MLRPALQPTSISCSGSPAAAHVSAGPSRALRPTSLVCTVRVLSTSKSGALVPEAELTEERCGGRGRTIGIDVGQWACSTPLNRR